LTVVLKKFRGGFGGFFAMLFGVLCFVRQSNQGVARFDCAQLRIVIAHALHGFNDVGCVGNFGFGLVVLKMSMLRMFGP
jgi:hypothetical protein